MADIKDRGLNHGQPGGAPIGSRQGGAPDKLDETDLQDQTQGSQPGSDIDLIPEP